MKMSYIDKLIENNDLLGLYKERAVIVRIIRSCKHQLSSLINYTNDASFLEKEKKRLEKILSDQRQNLEKIENAILKLHESKISS